VNVPINVHKPFDARTMTGGGDTCWCHDPPRRRDETVVLEAALEPGGWKCTQARPEHTPGTTVNREAAGGRMGDMDGGRGVSCGTVGERVAGGTPPPRSGKLAAVHLASTRGRAKFPKETKTHWGSTTREIGCGGFAQQHLSNMHPAVMNLRRDDLINRT